MSDHKNKAHQSQEQQQHALDRYELGPVDTLNDLAPETSVGPTRKATTQRRLLDTDGAGYFETEAGAPGGLGAPLHIGQALKKDGGPVIGEYESGYNTYALPYRSALRAMGRVKDVSLTGAPMTPEELKQRPDLMARFKRLAHDDGNWMRDVAYNMWSDHQTTLQLDIKQLAASQHQLAGFAANYRRVQAKLQQRELQAQRAADMAKVAQIRATADLLASVVNVCIDGVGAIGDLGGAINRELAADELVADTAADAASFGGSHGDDGAAGASTESAQQRVGAAATRAARGVRKGAAIASAMANQLKKTAKIELSLQGVFIAFTGDAKAYGDLQKDIAQINTKLMSLAFLEEAEELSAANELLKGFSIELAVQRDRVHAERTASRRGAQTFGKTLGKGNEGIAAMYAAEAWQELAAFGEHADVARKEFVDRKWRAVFDYLQRYPEGRYAVLGAYNDAKTLALNLKDVNEQRGYFNKHLPQWRIRAQEWRNFLSAQTGAELVVDNKI